MKTKEAWVTAEMVAEACQKRLAGGMSVDEINGSMIAKDLGTTGRHTVYKYVQAWRATHQTTVVMPAFVLPEPVERTIVAVVTQIIADTVLDIRQAAADGAAQFNETMVGYKRDVEDLLKVLADTEEERDVAVEALAETQTKLDGAQDTMKALEAALGEARRSQEVAWSHLTKKEPPKDDAFGQRDAAG